MIDERDRLIEVGLSVGLVGEPSIETSKTAVFSVRSLWVRGSTPNAAVYSSYSRYSLSNPYLDVRRWVILNWNRLILELLGPVILAIWRDIQQGRDTQSLQ